MLDTPIDVTINSLKAKPILDKFTIHQSDGIRVPFRFVNTEGLPYDISNEGWQVRFLIKDPKSVYVTDTEALCHGIANKSEAKGVVEVHLDPEQTTLIPPRKKAYMFGLQLSHKSDSQSLEFYYDMVVLPTHFKSRY